MNKNIMIVLGGAVAVAVLVAILVQVTLGGKKPVMEVAQSQILVAAKDLHAGDQLTGDSVRWQAWPKDSIFPGAVVQSDSKQSAAKALDGRLARDIASGEPVMKSALIGEAKGNIIAGSLSEGMRAVAIEVSASSMVGGFIGPGDYVDVLLTYHESAKPDDNDPRVKEMIQLNLDKTATETILQNVKILAIDQSAKRPDDDKAKIAKTITLEVTPQEAEKLALAGGMGSLTLSLRAIGDKAMIDKTWATTTDARTVSMTRELYSQYAKMQKDSGIHPNIVRIYSGDAVQATPTRPAAVSNSQNSSQIPSSPSPQ